MADVNTEGYLVQLQDENGAPLFPIISADLIKDSEGNTFDLPGLKSSVEQAEQDVATLQTSVDECFQSVSDGKTLIANAITGKGVTTSSSATFATMANNIGKIETISEFETNVLDGVGYAGYNLDRNRVHQNSSIISGTTAFTIPLTEDYGTGDYGISRLEFTSGQLVDDYANEALAHWGGNDDFRAFTINGSVTYDPTTKQIAVTLSYGFSLTGNDGSLEDVTCDVTVQSVSYGSDGYPYCTVKIGAGKIGKVTYRTGSSGSGRIYFYDVPFNVNATVKVRLDGIHSIKCTTDRTIKWTDYKELPIAVKVR